MADDEPKDSKVVRLHPPSRDAPTQPLKGPEPSVEEQIAAVERELKDVMGYARADAARTGEGTRLPTAAHRNVLRCPQCDGLTWRHTRHCVCCSADLVALAAERDERRREARRGALWLVAIASWALAPMCLYAAQHYALPLRFHRVLNWIGGAIIAINAAVFWYSSLDQRR